MESTWSLSRIVGILSAIAAALTFAASYFGAYLSPDVANIVMAIAVAINAFTGRVQGAPTGK